VTPAVGETKKRPDFGGELTVTITDVVVAIDTEVLVWEEKSQ